MKKTRYLLVILVLMVCMSVFGDAKGEEIGRKTFGLKKSNDMSAVAAMTLIDKSGNKRSRKLEMFAKETKAYTGTFIRFMEPADVSGTKFLSVTKNGVEEQRIYLPTMKKVRLISSSGKNGRFVNSDILYYDLESREYDDFSYRYIKDETLNGVDYSVVELRSVDTGSPYSRAVVWISKKDDFLYRMECYDSKSDELIKRIVIVEVKVIDGVIIPTKTVFDNLKDNTKTLLELTGVKVNTGLSDTVFSVAALDK